MKSAVDEAKVIDFNNVGVPRSEYTYLKNLYLHYHKKAYIFKKNRKVLTAINVTMNVFLSVVSSAAIVTAITVMPIVSVLGAASIVSMGLQKGFKLDQKIERSSLIFTMYNELIIKIKSYIRGTSYNKEQLLNEINQIEMFVNDLGVVPLAMCEKKYKKKFHKKESKTSNNA